MADRVVDIWASSESFDSPMITDCESCRTSPKFPSQPCPEFPCQRRLLGPRAGRHAVGSFRQPKIEPLVLVIRRRVIGNSESQKLLHLFADFREFDRQG